MSNMLLLSGRGATWWQRPDEMRDKSSILIIDSDASSVRLLGSILRARGFDVCHASAQAEAAEVIRSKRPSLILLGSRVGGSDGLELCRQLAQGRKSRHIPLLFITTRMDLATQRKALKRGAVDFICKPFQQEEVAARVKAQIDLLRLRNQTREISGRAAETRREADEWISFAMQAGHMYAFEWDPAIDAVHRSHHPASIPAPGSSVSRDSGRNWFRRIHRDDRSRLLKILSLLSPEYDTYDIQYRVSRPNGGLMHLRESARAFFDNRGRLRRIVGMAGEITEQVQQQRALERSRVEILELIQKAPVPIAVADDHGGFRYVNDRFTRTFGYHLPDVAEPSQWFTHAFPDDTYRKEAMRSWPASARMPLLEVDRGPSTYSIACNDGTRRLIEVSVAPFGGHKLILFDDVPERGRVAGVRPDADPRFRCMAETAPVMLWASGSDKGFTFFNQRWLEFTGRTMEQELGQGWAEDIHPNDRERCFATYAKAFDAREKFEMEYRLRRADGEYGWVLDRGSPYFAADGSFAGYIGSATDITEIKRNQETVLAMQSLESLGMLASGIAHDFNNLLGCILAYADLTKVDLGATSPALEGIEKIETLAVRGSEIVRQIMAYAGPDEGHKDLIDIGKLVEEMLDLLQISLPKGGRLELDFAPDMPPALANAAQLRQLVMNLILNAAEALEERNGLIVIKGRRLRLDSRRSGRWIELPEGDYIWFEVSDNGRGMTEEVRARIFDPFYSTKFQGRGMGLASVQKIVANHGGTIEVESAPAKGTRFQILLPAGAPTEQDTPPLETPIDTYTQDDGVILVVEDEERLRASVSQMLRKRGFDVIEASNGNLAVDLIRAEQNHIALVLLDLTVPGKSSLEVFEELRRTRPDAKVILTSASGGENIEASLTGMAPDTFIRKPYYVSQLVTAVCEALPRAEQCRH
jgi:two-component system, cell cycle sensor histidine kinase and response regulator CckA